MVGFLLTLNYDARNHEFKKEVNGQIHALTDLLIGKQPSQFIEKEGG